MPFWIRNAIIFSSGITPPRRNSSLCDPEQGSAALTNRFRFTIKTGIQFNPLRKAIMAIRRFEVAVTGASPLLLSNNLCSDPLSQASKDKKHFTSKRSKADADHMALRLIDWVYSGYWSKPGSVEIDDVENAVNFQGFSDLTLPSQNFARCLRNGATAFKLGKEVTRAVVIENEPLIQYNGPKTATEMVQDPRFILTSPVVRMKVTNWVTRLVLPQWAVNYQVTVDDERISTDALERICQAAGRFEGLGTWRPRFGRFTSELTELAV